MGEKDRGPSGEGRPLPLLASPCFHHTVCSYFGFCSSLVLTFPALLHLGSLPGLLWALHTHCGPSSQDTTIPAHTS